MRQLAIDTSVEAAIALVEGTRTLAHREDPNPRRHAEGLGELLTATVKDAGYPSVRAAGVDRIVVGRGPAPYTALRAGLAFAAALGRGLGVPVLGVPSLDGLAQGAYRSDALEEAEGDSQVLVLTDAKRGEVYYAGYTGADCSISRVLGPAVGVLGDALAAAQVVGLEPKVAFFGEPPSRLVSALKSCGATQMRPNAADLVRVSMQLISAGREDEFSLEPLYLRRPDVHVSTKATGK